MILFYKTSITWKVHALRSKKEENQKAIEKIETKKKQQFLLLQLSLRLFSSSIHNLKSRVFAGNF